MSNRAEPSLVTNWYMEDIDRLIAEKPVFHAWQDGSPADWGIAADVLRHLHDRLKPGMRTLETGAGHTTVVFALAGTEHLCVTPEAAEAERIETYCAAHGIRHRVKFVHESSEVFLPSGRGLPHELDLVLIDGAHRFPIPIIDWHYTESRLRVDGILALDDCNMPSVRVLHDFLLGEDEWALECIVSSTSFFRRTRPTVLVNDWQGQNINQPGKTKRPQPEGRLARLLGRMKG